MTASKKHIMDGEVTGGKSGRPLFGVQSPRRSLEFLWSEFRCLSSKRPDRPCLPVSPRLCARSDADALAQTHAAYFLGALGKIPPPSPLQCVFETRPPENNGLIREIASGFEKSLRFSDLSLKTSCRPAIASHSTCFSTCKCIRDGNGLPKVLCP